MFFYDGYICPVCKRKFQPSDDIVACPECGAPHHRTCWQQEGHCHFAADHGTPRQWKRPPETESAPSAGSPAGSPAGPAPTAGGPAYGGANTRTCSRCGKVNPEFAEFCSRCGASLTPAGGEFPPRDPEGQPHGGYTSPAGGSPYPFGGYGEYSPYHMPAMDPYGGVPRDAEIDGVPSEDLVTFVGANSAYYLPRFYRMSRDGSHVSWNWMSFLFTPYWLLYRKNYLFGSIVLVLTLAQTVVQGVSYAALEPYLDTSTQAALAASVEKLMENGQGALYLAVLSFMMLANVLLRIFFALTGNLLYMRTSLRRVRSLRGRMGMDGVDSRHLPDDTAAVADYRRELAVQGGVSLVLVAVACGVIWFGQLLVQALLYTG